MLLATLTADAAVFYVTPEGAGAKNGSTWDNAYDEAAFPVAIVSAGAGDEFRVKTGVYRPVIPANPGSITEDERQKYFVLKNGVALYGGFAGTEASSADRNPDSNFTVLTGDLADDDTNNAGGVTTNAGNIVGTNSICVVSTDSGCGPTTVLDGFTVTAGSNDIGNGGGMCNDSSSPTVTNCAFSGNRAYYGGGMYNDNSSPAVTDCTFTGNIAAQYGGGICNLSESAPTVTNCVFSGNRAIFGGGMCNIFSNPVVTNCTFSGNSAASDSGGGMYNINSNPAVTNCVFRDGSNGEIYNNGASAPTVTYCVVQSDDVGAGTISKDIISADPLLGPLAWNGGPTRTHALLPGSSAIDAASPDIAPDSDQRGVARPQGASFDIGAYEYWENKILTVNTIGSGSVTCDPSGDVFGANEKCWSYPIGTDVTLAAVEGARGFFVRWSGDASVTVPTATVTMSCDRYVEAIFDVAWIVTVSAGPGGDITATPKAGSPGASAPADLGASGTPTVKVRNGADQPFTVTPSAGYSIGGVRIDDIIPLGAVSTYTFANVSQDHTIEATFTANPTPTTAPVPTSTPTVTPTATPTPVPTPDPDIPLPKVTLKITLYAGGTVVAGPIDITNPATLDSLLSSPTLLAQLLATDPAAIQSGDYNMDLVRFFSLVADLDDGVLDFTILFEVTVEGVPAGYQAQLFMLTRTFDSKGNPTGYAIVPRDEGSSVFRKGSGARGWTETWRVTVRDGSAGDGDARRDGSVAPQIAAVVAVFPMATPTVTMTPTPGDRGSGGGCSLPAIPGAALATLLLLAPLLFVRRR
jgi:hypothetical protein